MLSHPGFRRLWALGGLNSTMRWLEMIVLGLLAFELTESPFKVSLAFFFRMIPMLLFGVLIGMLADRFNRKHLLVSGLVAQAVIFGALGLLIVGDLLEYWHLLAGTFLVGIVWASEFPVRRAMIGEIIGVRLLGRAMGVDSATFNFTRMVGPFMGGGLFEFLGPESTYLLGVGFFLAAAVIAATLDYTPPQRSEDSERNV
ncbi:MAG: MFS transporter, partial [Chloroflexota bacterium]